MRTLGLVMLGLTIATPVAHAADYYVDSAGGSDSNPGTAQAEAWQTLTPVHAATFLPGDTISFRRGGVWTEGLHIQQSGEPAAPITFTAYGDGPAPVFEAPPGEQWANGIRVESASHVIVEGFRVQNAHDSGVAVDEGSTDVVVRDCAATDVGIGIGVSGTNNRLTGCYLHDLHMVNNTQGGARRLRRRRRGASGLGPRSGP